jgi:hypothetical protein
MKAFHAVTLQPSAKRDGRTSTTDALADDMMVAPGVEVAAVAADVVDITVAWDVAVVVETNATSNRHTTTAADIGTTTTTTAMTVVMVKEEATAEKSPGAAANMTTGTCRLHMDSGLTTAKEMADAKAIARWSHTRDAEQDAKAGRSEDVEAAQGAALGAGHTVAAVDENIEMRDPGRVPIVRICESRDAYHLLDLLDLYEID